MTLLLQRALRGVKLPPKSTSLRAAPWPTRNLRTTQLRAGGRRYNSSQQSSSSTNPSPKAERPPPPNTPKDAVRAPKENSGPQDAKPDEPIDVPSSLWYRRLGPVTEFFGWFHRTQTKRPLTVQLCTTLITYLCGDLLAQEIGGEEYSGSRTLRMLLIGGVASIPGYKWFLLLGNNFNYASRWLSILTKVCVQQAVFTPVFNTYFFSMQAILTGESPSGVFERVKAAVPVSMWNSLKLWPAVTAISFAFIMPQYRFMFSGLFAVCWQAYLSFLNRNEEREQRTGLNVARKLGVMNMKQEEKAR